MTDQRDMSCVFKICLVFSLNFLPFVNSLYNSSTDSLDASLQDFAFNSLARHRPHTGALYEARLPPNLSGIRVSIVRLRSRTLYKKGANFSNIHIPPRTLPKPHVKRLALVYQDLGNWSYSYYKLPGYSFITSVVGFMVFDASNVRAKRITQLGLDTAGRPITIRFSSFFLPGAKCVAFGDNGTVFISEVKWENVCYSSEQGHFAVVVPVKRNQELWYLWVVGFVVGFGGLVLVGYFGIVFVKVLKTKKIQVMEREADDGERFQSRWVGGSKLPSATVTRTQPVLENGGLE